MTRAPAPSHTAVEPVAWLTEWKRDGEDWINAHANEVTALDEARAYSATITPLVPLSTLTAQAAALVAAERERDEAREQELWWKKCGDWEGDMHDFYRSRSTRLEAALLKVSAQLGVHAALSDTEKLAEIERLTGRTLGPVKLKERTDTRPETARAEAAETEVATLKARIAELEAGLAGLEAANAAVAGTRSQETYLSMIDRDHASDALLALDEARDRARRLTHQEKNNG